MIVGRLAKPLLAWCRVPDDWLWQPVLKFNAIQLALIGAFFWIEATMRGEAFATEVFGAFATSFPAEMWAAGLMAGGAFTYIGLIHPPRRPAILTGSFINVTQFLALSYSAIHTGGEMVIGLYASLYLAPVSIITAVKALHGPVHSS